MKSRVLMVCVFFLIAAFSCVGTVSCSQDLTSTIDDAEMQNGSDDVIQPLSEDEYRIKIAAIAVELIAIVNGLDEVLVNPEIENPDWITSVLLAMEDITTLCEEAHQLVPPESLIDIAVVNLEVMDSLDNAMDILAEGIDKNDIELVNEATTEIWLAAEILAEVIDRSE